MADRQFIDQLADTWSALAELGHSVEPTEWDAPTDCPGWSVKDHVSHVVGTESALLGLPAPPAPAAAAHVRNALGELNEAWVAERRRRAGAEVLAELEEVTAARLEALQAMSDEELDTPGPSPIGTVPYRVFMSVRVMDCWVHEQDVRQALGRSWRLTGPAAPAAIDRLVASFGYVVGKKVAPPEGSVVELAIEGPVARSVRLAVRAGRAVPDATGVGPTAAVATGDETYVRLATGRLAPSEALDAGLVRLAGDRAVAEAVVAHLAQMP